MFDVLDYVRSAFKVNNTLYLSVAALSRGPALSCVAPLFLLAVEQERLLIWFGETEEARFSKPALRRGLFVLEQRDFASVCRLDISLEWTLCC